MTTHSEDVRSALVQLGVDLGITQEDQRSEVAKMIDAYLNAAPEDQERRRKVFKNWLLTGTIDRTLLEDS